MRHLEPSGSVLKGKGPTGVSNSGEGDGWYTGLLFSGRKSRCCLLSRVVTKVVTGNRGREVNKIGVTDKSVMTLVSTGDLRRRLVGSCKD